MIDINNFISEYITKRPVSMFAQDIESNKEELLKEIQGKKYLKLQKAGEKDYNYTVREDLVYKGNLTF